MIQRSKQAWFEVWGNEVAQNQILKFLLLIFCFSTLALTTGLVALALRSPPLFAVSSIDSGMLKSNPPPKEYLENEAKRVVTAYLQNRHNWEATSIRSSIGTASKFVDDSFRKAFLQANETQIKIAQEKKISQRFYVSHLDLNLSKGSVFVTGDRILTIDGFRAVNPLVFSLTFHLGERTEQNPEGVYITSEQLLENGKDQK